MATCRLAANYFNSNDAQNELYNANNNTAQPMRNINNTAQNDICISEAYTHFMIYHIEELDGMLQMLL